LKKLALILAVAVPLSADTLIVLNKSDATASFLKLPEGKLVATAPTGAGPHEVDVSPDGKTAVVCNYGTGPGKEGSTLTVLDVASAAVLKTIDLGEYRKPHGVRFLPDGKRVAVTAEANQALLLIDVATGKIESAIKTDQKVSHMVAVDEKGTRAYVASIGSGNLTAIDLADGKVLKVIPTGDGAEGIALRPGGAEVWVTNRAADTVSVVDTASLSVSKNLASASFPIRVRFTPDGKRALVSNAKSGELAVFDAGTKAETRRIPMRLSVGDVHGRLFTEMGQSPVPIGILIPPDGKRAYIANANADVIAVLDLATWQITGTFKAGREPDGLGWSKLDVKPKSP